MPITADIRDNKFYQEAYQLGFEEGYERGIMISVVHKILRHRFGSVLEDVLQQLHGKTAKELHEIMDRALDAKQIEDVFGEQQN